MQEICIETDDGRNISPDESDATRISGQLVPKYILLHDQSIFAKNGL